MVIPSADSAAWDVGDIVFTEGLHEYTLRDGTKPLSVTQAMSACGVVDYRWCEEQHRERGSEAHRCIHLAVTNDLDWSTLDPAIEPFVEGALRAIEQMEAETVEVETTVYSTAHRIAGRPDWIGRVFGRQRLAVIDWKTLAGGRAQAGTAIQTAGYKICRNEMGGVAGQLVADRYTVALYNDATYTVTEHRERADADLFRAVALLANWRLAKGLLKR